MANPMQMWNSWFTLSCQAAQLGWEAQEVIALRMMRLAGGGAVAETETRRMISEKAAALAEAQGAAVASAVMGGQSHHVAKKVLGVYKKRVQGNRRRLHR